MQAPRAAGALRLGRIRKRYIILLLALLLVLWLGWVIAGAINARPGLLVDYGRKLLDLSAAAQPEGENGRPPGAMADLAPEFLPSIPIDPVSGQPFVLAPREATASDPHEWLLYSVGADGQDNDGLETPDPKRHLRRAGRRNRRAGVRPRLQPAPPARARAEHTSGVTGGGPGRAGGGSRK